MKKAPDAVKQILIVDDDPYIAKSVKMVLATFGYEIELTTSPTQALAMLEKKKYDLLITDLTMPLMKGNELALAAKTLCPGMPVILLTAYAESILATGQVYPGVDAIVPKPFDIPEFRAIVAQTFVSAASERAVSRD